MFYRHLFSILYSQKHWHSYWMKSFGPTLIIITRCPIRVTHVQAASSSHRVNTPLPRLLRLWNFEQSVTGHLHNKRFNSCSSDRSTNTPNGITFRCERKYSSFRSRCSYQETASIHYCGSHNGEAPQAKRSNDPATTLISHRTLQGCVLFLVP